MLIWTLVEPLVDWSVAEREQRLFRVCTLVQALLSARHPGYQTPSVQEIPVAVADEVTTLVKEILGAERLHDRRAGRGR